MSRGGGASFFKRYHLMRSFPYHLPLARVGHRKERRACIQASQRQEEVKDTRELLCGTDVKQVKRSEIKRQRQRLVLPCTRCRSRFQTCIAWKKRTRSCRCMTFARKRDTYDKKRYVEAGTRPASDSRGIQGLRQDKEASQRMTCVLSPSRREDSAREESLIRRMTSGKVGKEC